MKRRGISWILIGIGSVICWFLLVIAVPAWLRGPCSSETFCLGITASEQSLRQAILVSLGGLIACVTLWFTYRSHQLKQDEDWTKRYNEALAHIGSTHESVRIGGFYALERIGVDSERDRWRVMQVIASFLRHPTGLATPSEENAPKHTMSPVVDAAAGVLATLARVGPPEGVLNLSNAQLPNANFRRVDLTGASFVGANLYGIRLSQSTLKKADFSDANLGAAHLNHAVLAWATFHGSQLVHAQFKKADLRRARFGGADVNKTDFWSAALDGALFINKRVKNSSAQNATWKGFSVARSWDSETVWPATVDPSHNEKNADPLAKNKGPSPYDR